MSLAASIGKVSYLTRSSDWRFSFVPFIMGCVYLWVGFLDIPFNANGLILVGLSLVTTIGFAALGYFINEHFDKASDAKAGKVNKLALLKDYQQFLLLITVLASTLLPWLWLPSNDFSIALISTEIGLFLAYSLPFIRLKESPFLAGIVDSLYAYVVPLVLAFHTYSLFSNSQNELVLLLFAFAVFFIGFRNILIHQINDVIGDKRAGIQTLPMALGVEKTTIALKLTIAYEIAFSAVAFLVIGQLKPVYFIWLIVYLLFIGYRASINKEDFTSHFFTLLPGRHFSDQAYQVLFPVTVLLLLIIQDWKWIILLPIHVALLLPKAVIEETLKYLHLFVIWLRGVVSILVNYPIYFAFLIVGVNLKKRNMSASEYLKSKFGK